MAVNSWIDLLSGECQPFYLLTSVAEVAQILGYRASRRQ